MARIIVRGSPSNTKLDALATRGGLQLSSYDLLYQVHVIAGDGLGHDWSRRRRRRASGEVVGIVVNPGKQAGNMEHVVKLGGGGEVEAIGNRGDDS